MKYFIIAVSALFIAGACHAQTQYRLPGNVQVSVSRTPSYASENAYRSDNLADIERMYDKRVDEVMHDPVLTPHQKRKMIRLINEERKVHIKGINKYQRKESRLHRRYVTGRL